MKPCMHTYLIERTNKETGKTRIELVKAPFLALAFLEQETEYGKGYTYRLAEHLKVITVDDHNKATKDSLDRFHQYQKSMAENSYATPFTSSYRDSPDNNAMTQAIRDEQSRYRDMYNYHRARQDVRRTK